MRPLCLILTLIVACPSLAQDNDPKLAVFREAFLGPIYTLDPHLLLDPISLRPVSQIFEPLLQMQAPEGGTCKIVPRITALPEFSKDGLEAAIEVLDGIRFHDANCFPDGTGRQVMASDLRYTLLRAADPKRKSIFWEPYLKGRFVGLDAWRDKTEREGFADYDAPVEGIQAKGLKLKLKFTRVFPQLVALMTQPWVAPIPREADQRYGSSFGRNPVGAGPFAFSKFGPAGGVVLTKHPHYHRKGYPLLDEVRYVVVNPERDWRKNQQLVDQRILAGDLEAGDLLGLNLDTYLNSRGDLKTTLQKKGFNLVRGPASETCYLVMNFRHRFLAQLPVRQALCLALDRRKFVDLVEGPRGELTIDPVPGAIPGSSLLSVEPWEFKDRDVERAKRILKKAGYPDGRGIPELVLDVPGMEFSEATQGAIDLVKKNFSEIGIQVQVRGGTLNEFMERARSGEIGIGWLRWFADYPDAENFLTLFRSHPEDPMLHFNYGAYESKEYDALHEKMRVLYPSPARSHLIAQMMRVLRQDIPWIPLYHVRKARVVGPAVTNYRFNALDLGMAEVGIKNR